MLDLARLAARGDQLIIEATDATTRVSMTVVPDGQLRPALLPLKRFATLLDTPGTKRAAATQQA